MRNYFSRTGSRCSVAGVDICMTSGQCSENEGRNRTNQQDIWNIS
jgi:hypothetical protein